MQARPSSRDYSEFREFSHRLASRYTNDAVDAGRMLDMCTRFGAWRRKIESVGSCFAAAEK